MKQHAKHAVVVTGVSSGIGLATASELMARGYRVFGSVRTRADADRVQRDLGDGFTPLIFDVADAAAVGAAASQVGEALQEHGLHALVNNAGIVVGGPLMYVPNEEMRRQFEVNVFGLLRVTQAFLPLLGARRDCPHPPGRIVNVSSVSGHIAYPFLGPYAASKHAVEALSDSLRRELTLYGIDVVVVVLGSVQTPIWEKVRQVDAELLLTTDYAPVLRRLQEMLEAEETPGMPVEKASAAICRALEIRWPKTRYIVPNGRWTGWVLPRWLPTRLLDRIITKRLRLR